MGLFTKKRKDADYIKPKDTIQAIMPFIMNKRCDAEVSSTVDMDITKLVEFVDKQNEKDLGYKMTYLDSFDTAKQFAKYCRTHERGNTTWIFTQSSHLSHYQEAGYKTFVFT